MTVINLCYYCYFCLFALSPDLFQLSTTFFTRMLTTNDYTLWSIFVI